MGGSGSLSLPVDIPWKRMGFTASMMDRNVRELQFPALWRSSIAVDHHEPQDLPPDYANRRITYFKVVCTVTNFAAQEDNLFNTLAETRGALQLLLHELVPQQRHALVSLLWRPAAVQRAPAPDHAP